MYVWARKAVIQLITYGVVLHITVSPPTPTPPAGLKIPADQSCIEILDIMYICISLAGLEIPADQSCIEILDIMYIYISPAGLEIPADQSCIDILHIMYIHTGLEIPASFYQLIRDVLSRCHSHYLYIFLLDYQCIIMI